MASVKGRKGPPHKLAQPGRATIRDVAAAAGVSPMTVSNLINERSGTMRAETRKRIEVEIKRLGYRPHAMARGLRLAKQLSIGMIIIDEQPHYLADPFTTHVVAGLSNQLSSRGYGLLLQGVAPHTFQSSSLISGIRSDALCIMMSGPDTVRRGVVEAMLALGQPLVLFQDTLSFPQADVCLIRQADDEGGQMIAEEVLRLGARKLIMLVTSVHWPAIAERVNGVRKAVRHHGETAQLRIVECGDAELRDTQAALDHHIAANGLPDAIIAGNDQMGIAAMKLMAALEVKVPDDIVITGFNAFEFAQYTSPVLTTVRSPAYELGARGGVEVLRRLEEGRFSQQEIVYPVELQKGGST